MSETANKYKWVKSSTACSSCQAMATEEYDYKPDRPHDRCQCTIVTITGNNYGGMTDPLPRIVSCVQTGGHTEYDEGNHTSVQEMKERGRENFSARGEYYFDVTVRCPKNNEIVLNVVVAIEDGELFDVLMKWGYSKGEPTTDYEPPADEFEQEIEDAISDYSGGLHFKALEIARQILSTEGKELCNM